MKLQIGTFGFDGYYLWCQAYQMNLIFKVDVYNGFTTGVIGTLSDSRSKNSWITSSIIPYKDKVYFFSSCEYEVWILNKCDNSINHIILSDSALTDSCNVALSGDMVWIVPRVFLDKILRYNLTTGDVSSYDWIRPEWKGLDDGRITKLVVLNNKIFFSTRKRNSIMMFILDCSEFGITGIPMSDFEFVSCIFAQNECINILGLSTEGNPLLSTLNCNGAVINKQYYPGLEYNRDESYNVPYVGVITYLNKVLFIATHSKDCYIYLEGSVPSIKCLNMFCPSNERCSINDFFMIGKKVYLISSVNPYIYCLEMEDELLTKVELLVNENALIIEMLKPMISEKKVITENCMINIESFISAID